MQVVGLDENVDVLGGPPAAEVAVQREAATDEERGLGFEQGAQPLGIDELLFLVPRSHSRVSTVTSARIPMNSWWLHGACPLL